MNKIEIKTGNLVDENTLRETIRENINRVIKITGLNRATFAAKTGIAPPTLTGYLNPKESKIAPVTFLMNVCMMEEVRQMGLEITVNDLLSSDFDPVVNTDRIALRSSDHNDFLGVYDCYFFDQSKPANEAGIIRTRELRRGVLALFDDFNKLTGEASYEACAVFFKPEERDKTAEFRNEVRTCFMRDPENASERNARIRAAFRARSGNYAGSVTFSENHVFIRLNCKVFRDSALMVFYTPPKRMDHSYIGGLGAVCSVTRGSSHMPAAQKIIISKPRLDCSDEVIAHHLSMSSEPVELGSQAKLVTEISAKLFGSGSQFGFLDDSDKSAIITERLNQLVRDYIRNSVFSVGSVSQEEDSTVYRLIKKYS